MRQKYRSSPRGILPLSLLIISALALTGCGTSTPTTQAVSPTKPPADKPATSEPTTAPPTEAPEPGGEPSKPALPAEPQRIEFTASDGKNLVGHYFPAAVNPSPTVILMHWARGDQRDWTAIAPWLQNRPDELAATPDWADAIGPDCGSPFGGPWLDPSWFPPMPDDLSYGVFIFDFRDFCESEAGLSDPSEWTLDAAAAFETVASLPGVDPSRIAAIGASIGADGAPDGCLLHNQESDTCLGGFSLSPGDYLQGRHFTPSYTQVVQELEAHEPPAPVWCLAAENDTPSWEVCNAATGAHYERYLYDGDAHGMLLIVPEIEPNPLDLILDFLAMVFGN
jgi:dienelactone hydrolase